MCFQPIVTYFFKDVQCTYIFTCLKSVKSVYKKKIRNLVLNLCWETPLLKYFLILKYLISCTIDNRLIGKICNEVWHNNFFFRCKSLTYVCLCTTNICFVCISHTSITDSLSGTCSPAMEYYYSCSPAMEYYLCFPNENTKGKKIQFPFEIIKKTSSSNDNDLMQTSGV